MNVPLIIKLIYGNRRTIKKGCLVVVILVAGFIFFIYLIIATIFTVIQGQSTVVSDDVQVPGNFTEFQGFSYKTVYGERWYEFPHPYIFPTLGVLTQGVILDSSAVVASKNTSKILMWSMSSTTKVIILMMTCTARKY